MEQFILTEHTGNWHLHFKSVGDMP